MWGGTRRLMRLTVPSPAKVVRDRVGTRTKLALSRSRYHDVADLLDDCIAAAVDDLMDRAGGPSWDREGFAALRETVAAGLADAVLDVIAKVEVVLTAAGRVEDRLDRLTSEALAPAVADLRAQLAGLVHRGFVSAAGRRRLPDLVRYLRAMDHRMDKLASSQRRDRDRMLAVQELQRSYLRLLAAAPPSEELRAVRWMIEELRVSLFAQPIGTPQPISEQRIDKAMAQLGG
jgi:ATP-dependent helicase HrpA